MKHSISASTVWGIGETVVSRTDQALTKAGLQMPSLTCQGLRLLTCIMVDASFLSGFWRGMEEKTQVKPRHSVGSQRMLVSFQEEWGGVGGATCRERIWWPDSLGSLPGTEPGQHVGTWSCSRHLSGLWLPALITAFWTHFLFGSWQGPLGGATDNKQLAAEPPRMGALTLEQAWACPPL